MKPERKPDAKPDAKHRGSLGSDPRLLRAPGIERVSLTWDRDVMMCYFYVASGAELPLHVHPESQTGFVVKGRVDFTKGDGTVLELSAGDSYYFPSMDPHGLHAHAETELIECFAPARDDYKV